MSSPDPDPDPDQIEAGRETAGSSKGLIARIADGLSDPVLRALVAATAVSRIGRGVFLAVTVLFFTQIIGLSPALAAVVLAVSSGCGVVGSLLGGWLATRFGIPVDQLSTVLALLLPDAVDKASPDGTLPNHA